MTSLEPRLTQGERLARVALIVSIVMGAALLAYYGATRLLDVDSAFTEGQERKYGLIAFSIALGLNLLSYVPTVTRRFSKDTESDQPEKVLAPDNVFMRPKTEDVSPAREKLQGPKPYAAQAFPSFREMAPVQDEILDLVEVELLPVPSDSLTLAEARLHDLIARTNRLLDAR